MVLLLQIVTAIVIICYPLAVYFGLQYLPPGTIALLLCAILIARLALNKRQLKTMVLPILVGIGLTAASFIAKRNDWLLYYPVVINMTMLGLFTSSLIKGPSMIERLAKLKEPDLPDSAIPYLNNVTRLWCGLFIINGLAAFYTAEFATLELWTLYNGLIAYIFMGLLLGGEWIYRNFWLKKHE
ncbi:hypothetical protein L2737_19130 [Shewanella electrodiphila]|uniref:DNA gyrase subunit B n=1 Tax=Shewanella electrodiphila TaxID=934143 RepID=A0ABT0KU98_9GAMM|nr:hypothetical protein [Shewanella electrodiphila]MCL1047418.1 hypothetical protein [Shewanella electrodiphila]